MTETKAALLHKISQDARQAVQNWPKWKKEESDRAEKCRVVPESRVVHTPRRRHEIAVETRDDDDESFHPHSNLDDRGDQEHQRNALPHPAEPEKLRRQHIAEHDRPPRPGIRAEGAIQVDV